MGCENIQSVAYKRVTARNSYTVAFKDQDQTFSYGKIQYFCQLKDEQSKFTNLAIMICLPAVEGFRIYDDKNTWGLCKAHHCC